MIHYLDQSLKALLEHELPHFFTQAAKTTQVTISFVTPDGDFPPPSVPLPAIDMFLYDIRENRELRSNEYQTRRNGGTSAQLTRYPVRVECSYLVTAWGKDNSSPSVEDEHRLLGEVMKVLLRHPTIPEKILHAKLQDQATSLPTIVLQPGRLQSPGEFWQALGGKPKAAFHYTVTMNIDVYEPTDVPLVTEKIIRYHPDKEVTP